MLGAVRRGRMRAQRLRGRPGDTLRRRVQQALECFLHQRVRALELRGVDFHALVNGQRLHGRIGLGDHELRLHDAVAGLRLELGELLGVGLRFVDGSARLLEGFRTGRKGAVKTK